MNTDTPNLDLPRFHESVASRRATLRGLARAAGGTLLGAFGLHVPAAAGPSADCKFYCKKKSHRKARRRCYQRCNELAAT